MYYALPKSFIILREKLNESKIHYLPGHKSCRKKPESGLFSDCVTDTMSLLVEFKFSFQKILPSLIKKKKFTSLQGSLLKPIHYFNADAQGIRWSEPPPVETVTDHTLVHTNSIQLYEGSNNELLNWRFTLEQGFNLFSVILQFDGSGVATVSSSGDVNPNPVFTSRFNVSWVSGHVTLVIFNVSTSDEGVFSCLLTDVSGNQWKRNIQVAVVGN